MKATPLLISFPRSESNMSAILSSSIVSKQKVLAVDAGTSTCCEKDKIALTFSAPVGPIRFAKIKH